MAYNSDYEIRLAELEALGGDVTKHYDSVYEIDLAILEIVEGGIGTTYTAGEGISIDSANTISVDTDTIQEKLTAGDNIIISGNTISANVPQLEAGENVSIEDGKINALGYKAGISISSSFVELPYSKIEPYVDMTSMFPSTDLYFTGDAGATTYTVSGLIVPILTQLVGNFAFQVRNGNIADLLSYDSTNSTVTLSKSLNDSIPLSAAQMTKACVVVKVVFTGDANATTYSYVDMSGGEFSSLGAVGSRIKIGNYDLRTITAKSSNSITLNETLDANNAVSNAEFVYILQDNNTASAMGAHAEGRNTTASGLSAHAEGTDTVASNYASHAEGNATIASGESSHSEGSNTLASGRASHAEGISTTAQNFSEHAQGKYNVSHTTDTQQSSSSGNTIHSIGIGTYSASKNAVEVMANGDMYINGVGSYQGTNTKAQDNTIKTVQEVINGKADAYETATNAEIEAMFS